MHIRRVTLLNIKGLGRPDVPLELDFTHDDGGLAGWTVIAGPNGSGKTTVLQAIAMCLTVARDRSFLGFGKDCLSWLRDGCGRGEASIRIAKGMRDPWVTMDPDGDWTADDTEGATTIKVAFQTDPDAIRTSERAEATRDGYRDETVGWFAAGYGPYRRLARGSVDAQRFTDLPDVPARRLASLFREDAVFSASLQWLEHTYLRKLEGQADASDLLDHVFAVLNDGLLPDGVRLTHIDSTGLWAEQGGRPRPLGRLSDGYQTISGMLVDLCRQLDRLHDPLRFGTRDGHPTIENEGVVLIDEMELHLHPAWQQRVGTWFKDHFPHMQFIVTTHSPFICQAADPGGLIRLGAPGETARKLTGDAYEAVAYGTVDDAVLSDLFGLEEARSPEAARMLEEVTALEVRIARGQASARDLDRYRALAAKVPASADVVRALKRLGA